MKIEEMFRALFAGMAFPALCLPILYTALFILRPAELENNMIQLIPMLIPLFFGMANVVYVILKRMFPVTRHDYLLLLTGVILGLSLAINHVPTFIFVAFPRLENIALISLPIYYALIFRFIMKWFNKILGIK